MSKRLKLFNNYLMLCIDTKQKESLRKNAYKNKMNMSEYIRKLIELDNNYKKMDGYQNKQEITIDEVIKVLTALRRDK